MKTQSGILEDEEKYVQENSLNCKLFIYSETQHSRIAITDEQNTIRLIQEKPTEDFFKGKTGTLNLRFAETYLVVIPEKLSLIPLDLYDEGKDNELQSLVSESEKYHYSTIEKQGCIARFIPHDDHKFWLSILKDAELIPSSKIMIEYLTDLKVKYKTVVGLNFYANSFEVVYLEDNQLQFYGQFPCETPDELNFFLLTLFDKLTLTPALTQFYLWGDLTEGDELYQRLAKYSRNLSFASTNFLMEAITCASSQEH